MAHHSRLLRLRIIHLCMQPPQTNASIIHKLMHQTILFIIQSPSSKSKRFVNRFSAKFTSNLDGKGIEMASKHTAPLPPAGNERYRRGARLAGMLHHHLQLEIFAPVY